MRMIYRGRMFHFVPFRIERAGSRDKRAHAHLLVARVRIERHDRGMKRTGYEKGMRKMSVVRTICLKYLGC